MIFYKRSYERIILRLCLLICCLSIIDYFFGIYGIFPISNSTHLKTCLHDLKIKRQMLSLFDEDNHPRVEIGPLGAVVKGNKDDLPFYDMIITVPSPWTWVERRHDLYQAWIPGDTRTSKTSRLLFPVSPLSQPPVMDERDEKLFYSHSTNSTLVSTNIDVLSKLSTTKRMPKRLVDPPHLYPPSSASIISVPCDDYDFEEIRESNSSTICKVLESICYAVEHYRFDYLARVGDDTYFRWDYFLERIAPTLPQEKLWMGMRLVDGKVPQIQYFQNLYHFPTYPPYMSGMGSIITADVAYYLCGFWKTRLMKSSFPEDGILGLYLFPLQLNINDSPHFHSRTNPLSRPWRQQPCTNESIMIHYMQHPDWEKMDENGVAQC